MRNACRQLPLVLLLLVGCVIPTHAAGPSIIMVYGGSLQKPISVVLKEVSDLSTYAFLSCGSGSGTVKDVPNRPYVRIAMFWNKYLWERYLRDPNLLPQLKPEQANQHGRLYLPTSTEGATVVATTFKFNESVPVPENVTEFTTRCLLTAQDVETSRRLGIPGL